MQAALLQDAAEGGAAANLLRFVSIDIATGKTTHEYAYLLTTGSGVSDIVALNSHEFLVDERDGSGLGDGDSRPWSSRPSRSTSTAPPTSPTGRPTAAQYAVAKTLFLDIVAVLNANGFTSDKIPAKLEGLRLVRRRGLQRHDLSHAVGRERQRLPAGL